jgi:histidinol-phosphate aminotransferase
MLSPRAAIRIPAYHPPLAGREGLRLDFNENTVGCSPRALERLKKISPDDLARYPERGNAEEHVAQFLGVSPSELLLTNGVDEAIHLLCQTYLDPGDEALIVVPTYSMYRIYMMAAGANVTQVAAGADFQFPTDQLIDSISRRTRLIAIANPNNPTGSIASKGELLRIARNAPSAAVLIDEAYFEFYGRTMLEDRQQTPNLFVARTFSKAYGLAGLRIGVLIGNADQMRAVKLACSPYNVNAIALACLPEALSDQEYVEQYVSEVRQARKSLENTLESLGIRFWPSHANFVLARVSPDAAGAAAFVESMKRRGILVRDRSNDFGCEGCVRITLASASQTDRLLNALNETLKDLGIAHGVSRS